MAQKAATTKKEARTSDHYQKALDSFEKATRAMHKGDAAKAKEMLVQFGKTYGSETELMDRVRSYISVCESRLAPESKPKTAEELANAGVVSLNMGDPEQAIKHFAKAIEIEPKSSHVQYCLAAAHGVCGDAAASAKYLEQAIGSDPAARIHARADEDFASVRNSEAVSALIGTV